jgi:hypothetical protein
MELLDLKVGGIPADRPGHHRVDADALGRELLCHRLHVIHGRSLGLGVIAGNQVASAVLPSLRSCTFNDGPN